MLLGGGGEGTICVIVLFDSKVTENVCVVYSSHVRLSKPRQLIYRRAGTFSIAIDASRSTGSGDHSSAIFDRGRLVDATGPDRVRSSASY